jgi:hypothetical protein
MKPLCLGKTVTLVEAAVTTGFFLRPFFGLAAQVAVRGIFCHILASEHCFHALP